MSRILKAAAAAALLAGGATIAIAQSSTTVPPSVPPVNKVEPGAPGADTKATPPDVGSRPIGPPADTTMPGQKMEHGKEMGKGMGMGPGMGSKGGMASCPPGQTASGTPSTCK